MSRDVEGNPNNFDDYIRQPEKFGNEPGKLEECVRSPGQWGNDNFEDYIREPEEFGKNRDCTADSLRTNSIGELTDREGVIGDNLGGNFEDYIRKPQNFGRHVENDDRIVFPDDPAIMTTSSNGSDSNSLDDRTIFPDDKICVTSTRENNTNDVEKKEIDDRIIFPGD